LTIVRHNYQLISAIAFVVGIALITVAELASLDWTRAFGAAAISFGALGIGVYVGMSQPGRYVALRERLSEFKQPIGVAILTLLFVPALTGLLAGIIGLFSDPDGTGWVVVTGAVVLVLMLAATAAAFAVGLRAVLAVGEGGGGGGEPQ
jgi:hypothetical protein